MQYHSAADDMISISRVASRPTGAMRPDVARRGVAWRRK